MICVICGHEMFLDDVDFNFEGNKDNYWLCESCECSCIEEIRFNKPFQERWNIERNDKVINFTKKCIMMKGI